MRSRRQHWTNGRNPFGNTPRAGLFVNFGVGQILGDSGWGRAGLLGAVYSSHAGANTCEGVGGGTACSEFSELEWEG